jgi:O-antigen ligase
MSFSPKAASLPMGGSAEHEVSRLLSHLPRSWLARAFPAATAVAALMIAALVGRFFADGHTTYAAALVLAVCYAPLVLLDFTVAFAIYVGILFVQDISALSIGPNSIGVLVLLGWAGTFINRSSRTARLRDHARLLLLLFLLAVWLAMTILFSSSAYAAENGLQNWLVAVLAFVVALTTPRKARDVAIIAIAFIAGAVASVLYGLASGAFSSAAISAGEAGRFTGGGGDPNVQAAGFLAAMFLCPGLWPMVRGKIARFCLVVAFVAITIGFFATQSRGGFISLAFAALVGIALLPEQRKRLIGLAGAACAGLGVVAAVNPAAVSRITDFSGGTSGRSDIWTVAWKIFNTHPAVGIGINNFQTVEPRYALQSGALKRADLITEVPHLVHNVYLQMLTEAGIIGFLIFLLVIAGCVRSSWFAARRFDAIGRTGYGDLARAILLAEIGMLSAQFFISDGEDLRLWILLGLGPALLSLARRSRPARKLTGELDQALQQ